MTQRTSPAGPARPELARALLWNFSLFLAAAVSLAVATTLVALALEPGYALVAILLLILADVGILFVFGRYLIGRLVVRPVGALMEAADAIAAGDFGRRAPPAETREFSELADRVNGMTEALLDAQSQVVRAEKLAGVGRLAAGVAHEIGNPLAAIQNYVDVLRQRAGDAEVTQGIGREAERIDRIVRGLLSYARPTPDEPRRVDIESVVHSVVSLLTDQGALREHSLVLEIEPDLPSVTGRVHALEQVVVNLLLNAMDAAPAASLTVGAIRRVAPARREEPRRGDTAPAPPRRPTGRRPLRAELADVDGVLLYVADTGPGVPEPDRERIFDPFYTTKDPGRGTGLGLAIVQRSVHEMGGVVWVEEAREGGAAFKIFLPAADTAPAPDRPDRLDRPDRPEGWGGAGP